MDFKRISRHLLVTILCLWSVHVFALDPNNGGPPGPDPDSLTDLDEAADAAIQNPLPSNLKGLDAGEHSGLILKIDPGQHRSVYELPGDDYVRCNSGEKRADADACVQKAFPGADAEINWTGKSKVMLVPDPRDPNPERLVETYFLEVHVKYVGKKPDGTEWPVDKVGWIRADPLEKKSNAALYQPKTQTPPQKNCPPDKLKPIALENDKIVDKVLNDDVAKIRDKVGKCENKNLDRYFNNANPEKLFADGQRTGPILFDREVLPYFKGLKDSEIPKVQKQTDEDGNHMMTREDLITIDALARTLYGEMGICYDAGPEFVAGVARVIVNRAEFAQKKFDQEKPVQAEVFVPQDDERDEILSMEAETATEPSQFDNWRFRRNIRQSLCPPAEANHDYWQNKCTAAKKSCPPGFELDLWNNVLKIASEAVLHPEEFKMQTADLNGIYHYTSGGPAERKGYKLLTQNFHAYGRPLNRPHCMRFWEDITNQQPKAATKHRKHKKKKKQTVN